MGKSAVSICRYVVNGEGIKGDNTASKASKAIAEDQGNADTG